MIESQDLKNFLECVIGKECSKTIFFPDESIFVEKDDILYPSDVNKLINSKDDKDFLSIKSFEFTENGSIFVLDTDCNIKERSNEIEENINDLRSDKETNQIVPAIDNEILREELNSEHDNRSESIENSIVHEATLGSGERLTSEQIKYALKLYKYAVTIDLNSLKPHQLSGKIFNTLKKLYFCKLKVKSEPKCQKIYSEVIPFLVFEDKKLAKTVRGFIRLVRSKLKSVIDCDAILNQKSIVERNEATFDCTNNPIYDKILSFYLEYFMISHLSSLYNLQISDYDIYRMKTFFENEFCTEIIFEKGWLNNNVTISSISIPSLDIYIKSSSKTANNIAFALVNLLTVVSKTCVYDSSSKKIVRIVDERKNSAISKTDFYVAISFADSLLSKSKKCKKSMKEFKKRTKHLKLFKDIRYYSVSKTINGKKPGLYVEIPSIKCVAYSPDGSLLPSKLMKELKQIYDNYKD